MISSTWIPIEDDLPENGAKVDVLQAGKHRIIDVVFENGEFRGYYYHVEKGTISRVLDAITHWMPVPKYPD
jgi:hypothetical protein